MQEDSFTGENVYQQQLEAVRAGDDNTLQQLYRDNYRYVEKFILNNSGTSELAKDIFQEAYIAMWKNVQEEKFVLRENSSLSSYLQRIAKNKWLDYLRSAGYKRTVALQEDFSENLSGEEAVNNLEESKRVREKFQLLGNNCKELLTRFYYKSESLRTIAGNFGWTESTAKNNKYRCIERLRALLKKS